MTTFTYIFMISFNIFNITINTIQHYNQYNSTLQSIQFNITINTMLTESSLLSVHDTCPRAVENDHKVMVPEYNKRIQ